MEKPINNHHFNARRILILGTTGMGKSTAALRLVSLIPADLVLVYDWQGGELADRLGAEATSDREDLMKKIERGDRVVAYDPGEDLDDERQEADFAWFCKMAREVCGQFEGRKLVVVDESQDLMTAHRMPGELYRLLARGRRREIDSILIASAANAIHGKARNQVSELFCFRCVDENALEYPVSLGLEKQKLQELPPGHFIHRAPNGKHMELALWDEKSRPTPEPSTQKEPRS